MSAEAPVQRVGNANGALADNDVGAWRANTRVFLQPIAAPSILGLFGFAGATFMVAANMAGWFGTATSAIYIFPFAAIFGAIAAAFENLGLCSVMAVLSGGSALAAVFFLTGVHGWETAAGWVLLVSSLASYTAFAMMLEGAAGRVILPLGALR